LWKACEIGDLTLVKSTVRSWWISKEERINKADPSQNTPLVLATKRGHLEIVRLLLENEASPHHPDSEGYLPLHWASKIGSLDLVKLLVIKGANINAIGLYQRTPLHMAAHNGQAAVVAWLLSVKGSINAKASAEDNLTTPLHEAVIRGHLGVVQILNADPNLNVNLSDNNQQSPLYYAVLNGDLNMVQTLTKHKSWCNPPHSNHPNHLSQLLKLSPPKNKAEIQAYLEALNKYQLNSSTKKQ
jgi:ankyrin repeat protein